MEILLGFFDLIPVVLCFVALWELQTSLYGKMNKYSYALLASGSIMVLFAGTLKALWKIVLYSGGTDFYRWDYMFFPVQAFGFVLATIGLWIYIVQNNKNGFKLHSFVILATILSAYNLERSFEGVNIIQANDTMIYVALQVIGSLGVCSAIAYMSFKNGDKINILFASISVILMMIMGYMSSAIGKASPENYVLLNWVAEAVNTLGQGFLFYAVLRFKKSS